MLGLSLNLRGMFLVLIVLSVVLAGGPGSAGDAPTDRDEELLKESGVAITAEALTQLLRDRSPEGVDLKRLEMMVGQLSSDDFNTRETASRELLKWGQFVRESLEKAAKDEDAERANRAKDILKQIKRETYLIQPRLAARLLVKRWPEKAVEPLLYHLPFADEETAEEMVFSLDALVVNQKKVPEAMVQALQDRATARRAAAAAIAGRRGTAGQKAAVARLLGDAEPVVRLRAAQGLLAAKDKIGLPTLIALLDELDVAISWQAEELLRWAAGDSPFTTSVGVGTAEQRQLCRTAWEKWYRDSADQVDLEKCYAAVRRPGLFLICSTVDREKPGMGRVWLRGCDGQPRWQIPGDFVDAQLLPGNRVLLGERKINAGGSTWTGEVTERDLGGRVLWKVDAGGLRFSCRRLSNGNTFISDFQIPAFEIDADGKKVVEYDVLGQSVVKQPTWKLDNGRIAWSDVRSRTLFECDAVTGQLTRKVQFDLQAKGTPRPVGMVSERSWLINYTPRPPAGVKAWEEPRERVVEIDETGKVVWQCPVPFAMSALRLRNGHTILGSWAFFGSLGHPGLVEADRDGKKLWEDFNVGFVLQYRGCLPLVGLGFDPPSKDVEGVDSVATRVKGLKDKDRNVRHRSVLFLAEMGAKAEPAVPALIEALDDSDRRIAETVQEVLWQLGPVVLPAVLNVLGDKRPQMRAHAVSVLGHIKWTNPEDRNRIATKMLEALRDENAHVRRKAAWALQGFPEKSEEILPALIQALKDKDKAENNGESIVAMDAASSLGALGVGNQAVLSALMEATRAEEERLQGVAFRALGRIGAKDKSTPAVLVPWFLDILKDDKQSVAHRTQAALALGSMGTAAKDAVAALRDALRLDGVADAKAGEKIRTSAVYALGMIGPEAAAAVPDLILMLKDTTINSSDRGYAASALGNIGPAAKEAIPKLTEIINDRDEEYIVQRSAELALEKIKR